MNDKVQTFAFGRLLESALVLVLIAVGFKRTVLPTKSDSDIMFVYKVIRGLESIDHLCINPICRIGLIHT